MAPTFEDGVVKTLNGNVDSIMPPHEAASPSPQDGVCVPQRRYMRGASRGSSDHQGKIIFFLEGGYFPVDTASRGEYTGLIGRDVPVLTESGDTIMIRFEWPGYPPQEYQLRTIDWCALPNKITLSRLATEVAKVVEKFIREMGPVAITPEQAQWKVGQGGIQAKDLRLAALDQVSKGSWQARLFYKPTL
jgi:hypothetical protein